jgi:molybdopterin synthase catalytic subunit
MRVHILPFGSLKDHIRQRELDLPERASVADLLAAVGEELPAGARAMLAGIAVSVNAEYARGAQTLREGDEVGLLPPVSGGSQNTGSGAAGSGLGGSGLADSRKSWLTREPIPTEALVMAAKQPEDGALVVFDGIVRNHTRGRKTLHLDYEAYEEMAERQMAELAAQAEERFGVRRALLVHRLGRLEIGETSVLIVVASAHRAAAFEACRWLIDTLKKTVPIWKREAFADGVVWADGEPFPAEIAVDAGSPPGESVA